VRGRSATSSPDNQGLRTASLANRNFTESLVVTTDASLCVMGRLLSLGGSKHTPERQGAV